MQKTTAQEISQLVGGQLEGDGQRVIGGMATIESAGPEDLSFIANARYEKHLSQTRAGAVIVSTTCQVPQGLTVIRCQDPYFAFREAMVAFYGFRKPSFEGISNQADIHPSAVLGQGVRIASFAAISRNVAIGDNTVIYPGVFIGPDCRIGDDCTLYPNVTVYDGCCLGNRVTIHAGSSIGHDGFGYATYRGRHEKIPQVGNVVVEDDVEIGACCTIDRSTLGATVIGAGTKFSNLVAIGHGTRLGRGCLLVAQAGIAGSAVVGNYCVFAGQSGVVGHIRIGDGARIGAQSGVTHDISAGQEVLGSPAVILSEARRSMVGVAKLPQLRATVARLSDEVQKLRQQLEQMKRPPDNSQEST